MKVALLGAGGMGELALKDLVSSRVEEIVVADYDEAKAERLRKLMRIKTCMFQPSLWVQTTMLLW